MTLVDSQVHRHKTNIARNTIRQTKHFETYGRILHWNTPAIFPRSSALEDGRRITYWNVYWTSPASMVTIDEFLSPIALSEMFQYLTKTIFFMHKSFRTRGYLGVHGSRHGARTVVPNCVRIEKENT